MVLHNYNPISTFHISLDKEGMDACDGLTKRHKRCRLLLVCTPRHVPIPKIQEEIANNWEK